MPKKKKCPECVEGAPDWLVTFSDMVTLLLCFFVLLLIFMQPKKEVKLMRVLENVQKTLGSSGTPGRIPNKAIPVQSMLPRPDTIALYKTYQRAPITIATVINESDDRSALVSPQDPITIGGPVVFNKESAVLTNQAAEQLERVVSEVRGKTNIIEIRGHTSPDEFDGDPRLQWLLSYERAFAVLDGLRQQGIKVERLRPVATGIQETVNRGRVNELPTQRADIVVTATLIHQFDVQPINDPIVSP